MRTASRRLAAFSALALAATGVAVTATTASASLVTHCSGEAENVTVPGDLVVPAGSSCVLDNVTIDGQARVMAGADLIVTNTRITDAVFVNADGYFDATDSSMDANVTNRGSYGVFLDDATIGGGYFGREADGGDSTFAYAHATTFEGRVQVEQGEVYLDSSQVSGHLETTGTSYTDVLDSTLYRTLTVTGAQYGAQVCASEIDGDAIYRDNGGAVRLGGGDAQCEEVNYFGSDVVISANTGGVEVTGNIIRGDLTGESNEPAPTGGDNRVRGDLGGQFTDLQPSGPSVSLQRVEQSPSDLVTDKREQRRDGALDEAEKIGPAGL